MIEEYEYPEGNDRSIFELILRLYRIILINMYIDSRVRNSIKMNRTDKVMYYETLGMDEKRDEFFNFWNKHGFMRFYYFYRRRYQYISDENNIS
jgi:hypothetical protein